MLTVKHIDENRVERICSAVSVQFYPGSPNETPLLEAFGAGSGGAATYQSGVVYVMNEAGATVGKYDLRV